MVNTKRKNDEKFKRTTTRARPQERSAFRQNWPDDGETERPSTMLQQSAKTGATMALGASRGNLCGYKKYSSDGSAQPASRTVSIQPRPAGRAVQSVSFSWPKDRSYLFPKYNPPSHFLSSSLLPLKKRPYPDIERRPYKDIERRRRRSRLWIRVDRPKSTPLISKESSHRCHNLGGGPSTVDLPGVNGVNLRPPSLLPARRAVQSVSFSLPKDRSYLPKYNPPSHFLSSSLLPLKKRPYPDIERRPYPDIERRPYKNIERRRRRSRLWIRVDRPKATPLISKESLHRCHNLGGGPSTVDLPGVNGVNLRPPSLLPAKTPAMPAVVASRTQCNEHMFEALKKHIMKERQKKKEEQEADAEVERQRKERELQQKQDVMTLEENREQIAKLEQTLAQLKVEKHKLFLQLKKVLNEDDNRRRQLIRQHNEAAPVSAAPTTTVTTTSGSGEVVDMYGMYPGVPPMAGHLSHLVMSTSYPPPMGNREPIYKVPPPPNSFMAPNQMKRPRSPSPPPPMQTFHQNYNQKPAPPQPRVTYPKSGNYNYYHHNSGSMPSSVPSAQPSYGYPGQPYAPPATSRAEISHNDPQVSSKHPIYLSQQIPRPNLNTAYMHSSMDHSKIGYPDDKYYPVAPIRPATHVPLHGGAIPIQQPAQGTKTGGITSGYPIRPPASAPPSHIAPVASTHGMYASQASTNSRLVYSQAANRAYMQPRQDQC